MSAAVDAGRLLKDLDELWRGYGQREESGVLRACAMTLIAVAGDRDDPQQMGETLAELMREHPSRSILVRAIAGSGDIEGRASVQCWMPFGRRQQICCEQIQIEAPQAKQDGVAPLLLGLSVADLPVVLWAKDPALLEGDRFAAAVRLAGKVIVDTSLESDTRAALSLVQRLRTPHRQVADLAWTRITRWRETVRSVFELTHCKERARRVESIELEWSGQGMPTPVAYLAAWLQKAFPGASLIPRVTDPVLPPRGVGRIRAIRFRGQDLDLKLTRPQQVGVAIEIEALRRSVLFPVLSDAALLREELAVLGRDESFEQALVEAFAILETRH
jgi:glucose-6-phosphate dehydrogenase assembly protein OpcA